MMLVEEAQVFIERCVMKLPIALGIGAVGAGSGKNRFPQKVDRHFIVNAGEDMLCPGNDGSTCDTPRVDVEVQTTTILAALRVACASRRLRGIDSAQSLGVGTLNKNEACTIACERIQLLALPLRHLLKIRRVNVLVRQTLHGIVMPKHGYMAGAGCIGLCYQKTREFCTLYRSIDNNLLPRANIHALAHDQSCITLDGRTQRYHSRACIGRRQPV